MKSSLEVVYGLIGLGAVSCFLASLAAHLLLQFYIDHERVQRETGEPGWKVFGSMMASVDFYKPQAAWLWKVRQKGFAGFFIFGGLAAVVAIIASVT